MNWFLYILLGFAILLLFMIITRLQIKIDFLHEQDNDHFKITVKAWKFIKFTYDVPMIKVDEESPAVVVKQEIGQGENPKAKDKTKKVKPKDVTCRIRQSYYMIKKVVGLHIIVKNFLKHIHVHKIEWKTSVGLGDAAHTGIVAGVLWTIKGNTIGLIHQFMDMKTKPSISVTPYFQGNVSKTHLLCIFSFRIGQAIVAALRMLKYWKGKTKRRKPTCQNIQSKA